MGAPWKLVPHRLEDAAAPISSPGDLQALSKCRNTSSDFRTVFFLWSALLTESSVVNQNIKHAPRCTWGAGGSGEFTFLGKAGLTGSLRSWALLKAFLQMMGISPA